MQVTFSYQQNISDDISCKVVFSQPGHGAEQAVHEEGWNADEEEEVVKEVDWMRVDVQFGDFYVHLIIK